MAKAKKIILNTANMVRLLKNGINLYDLSDRFDVSPSHVTKKLKEMEKQFYNIKFHSKDNTVHLDTVFQQGNVEARIDTSALGKHKVKFGVCGDAHLASKFERLDILNAIYDEFADAGIKTVYNTGNWIDGYIPRINGGQVWQTTWEGQTDYFLEHYPKRRGIKTCYVSGDDHEGWFQRAIGIDVGKALERKAHTMNRKDLEFIGFVEGDVQYPTSHGAFKLRVMHPGGGSAYALSYAPQKLVESMELEDRPHMLVIGHYHKGELLPNYNGVYVLQSASTMDQTPFLRKLKIKSTKGAWTVELDLNDDGSIYRCTTTWLGFYSKKWYVENNFMKKDKVKI